MPILTDRQSVPPALTARVDKSQDRILYALSEKDRAQFYPSYREGFPTSDQQHQIDTGSFKSYPEWEDYLAQLRPTVMVSCWSTPPLPTKLLHTEALPLRYLCHTTGTVRRIVPREFLVGGGIVTNWGNVISQNVAEHAVLLILSSLRNITHWRAEMKKGHDCWGNGQLFGTRSLQGKKVGLHGFGNIAMELIRLLSPFNVEFLAFSQNVPHPYIKSKGVFPCADLKELFRKSDIIIECEALTEHSRGSVTEELLRTMQDDSVFVNVGRGDVVDEKGMAAVAAEGRIRIASDVFQREPLPKDSPLLNVDGVILSPHIAGPAGDWFHRCGEYAMNNVARYLEGKPLLGEVTLEIYDRST